MSGAQSKHEQARRALLTQIRKAKPHSILPSDRALSDELGMSRMTVRKALESLQRENLIYTRPGLGTFVAEPRFSKTTNLTSFSQEMRAKGIEPGAVVLLAEVIETPIPVRDALALDHESQVYHIKRIRTGDGEPLCLEDTYVPASAAPGLIKQDLSGSLYSLLRDRYEHIVALVNHVVTAVQLADEEASLLHVPAGSPALLFSNTSWDEAGRPLEYTQSLKRADRNDVRYDVQPSYL